MTLEEAKTRAKRLSVALRAMAASQVDTQEQAVRARRDFVGQRDRRDNLTWTSTLEAENDAKALDILVEHL